MHIRWSIITVTYNSADTLRAHWSPDRIPSWAEWIVVDNGSSDQTVDVATSLGARVVRQYHNTGFSAANNVGYAKAMGDYIAFVNPDIIVDWESFSILECSIDANGALVAPQLINPDGSLQPNGRGVPSLLNKVRNRVRSVQQHRRYRLFAEPGVIKPVTWAIGAAIAGSRTNFDRLDGPWDSRFFLYYEDSEIGLRAWQRAIPVLLIGDARWIHSWARATIRISWQPWRREVASMIRFYSRYPRLVFTSKLPNDIARFEACWGLALGQERNGGLSQDHA